MNTHMPIGVDDFKKVREQYYFVDKTDFIRQIIDTHSDVTLITRPRRFGKTLTLSMLDYFFSIEKKDISRRLFSGLAIESAGSGYMSHQGKFPVIFLTLKGVQNDSWEELYDAFQLCIQKEFLKHDYVLQGALLKESEKDFYQRILNRTADEAEYQISLLNLSSYLYRYYDVKPIILIDEYDAPIQCAYEHKFYDTAISYFKSWFNNTLKSNENLNFAILTGVLRIAKESIFSGLNNLDVCTVMTDKYSNVFGFTFEEVKKMAHDLQQESYLPQIKAWYDGYRFGKSDIYNPWSVVNFFDKLELDDYWVNTSGNVILKELLRQSDLEREKELLSLLHGNSVTAIVREGVIYDDISKDKDALYTMLLTTGYLTAISKKKTIGGQLCQLAIPNREIKDVYRYEILDNMRPNLAVSSLIIMMEHLVAGHIVPFSQLLERYISCLVSTYDTANKESFYHGFLLGMTALLVPEYIIESNRESGYGRFDLAIFPKDSTKAGVLMEFKAANSESQLERKAKEALRQITDKQYDMDFAKHGISTVWKYGIAFCGKKIHVVMQ